MDISMGGAGGSSDEQDAYNNSHKEKKSTNRHTSHQIHRLEAFYKDFPHPDENQRIKLGRELGLEPKQVKFWFQNKRTQMKSQNERTDNSVLRAENERMQCENIAIKEALKNVSCPSCGGPSCGEEEREITLQNLQLENARLKQEYERAANLFSRYIGKPMSQIDLLAPTPTVGFPLGSSLNQGIIGSSPRLEVDFGSGLITSDGNPLPNQDTDKALMFATAASSMEELVRLLRINEPLWIKSEEDGPFILNLDSYERIFPRAHHFKSSNIRVESSKASRIVTMSGMQLVDMFLDSDKWVNHFPTIVTKAKTLKVLETGLSGSRKGALQLMYEEMHILSPFVTTRDFIILRYCHQIDIGTWVIADVSFDSLEENNISLSGCWRLPSGCLIHEMPNGSSMVTWVEHVEVDGRILTHQLYRDLVSSNIAYGAERWVMTLQRMCDRISCFLSDNVPRDEAGGVISLPEGRRSFMNVAHRMIKSFCGVLNMSGRVDFPQLSEVNNSGVRVAIRRCIQPGQPNGLIVSAATSVWLSVPSEDLFNFLRDERKRVQWDVLTKGNPVQEIGHISNGTHPGNCISIIRPFIPTENSVLILQETCVDPMGYLVVYAPVDLPAMNMITSGEESSMVPILPSGFVITEDGSLNRITGGASSSGNDGRSGSILTVAFQVLVCCPSATRHLSMESVASVSTVIGSTIQKIKGCFE